MSSTIFQLVSYDSGFFSHTGTNRILENAFAVAVGDPTPFGEWSEFRQLGDFKIRHKAAIQEWKFISDRPVYVNWDRKNVTIAGDFCEIKHDSYFSDYEIPDELKNHDLCLYCGHDNGKNGEYRNGWDCYWCGGN